MSNSIAFDVEVKVTVHDRDVIERVTGPGGDEWRAQLYDLHTESAMGWSTEGADGAAAEVAAGEVFEEERDGTTRTVTAKRVEQVGAVG